MLAELFCSDLVKRAMAFGREKHKDQKRRYDGLPYFVHPVAVAGLVAGVGGSKEMVAAALLHDVVEDCGVKYPELVAEFGAKVADLVMWLSDVSKPEDGNRKARKALDREHSAQAPAEAKSIKLADLLDNARSIVEHDPNFALVYMREVLALLEVLKEGERSLYLRVAEVAHNYYFGFSGD